MHKTVVVQMPAALVHELDALAAERARAMVEGATRSAVLRDAAVRLVRDARANGGGRAAPR